ncbi:MAG: hypothetical protein Fur0020_05870 [Thermodesulfovibrionia bacterium]
MLNLRRLKSGAFLILLFGVVIVGIGLVFTSCGKDPQLKVATEKGQFAIDFSMAPGAPGADFGVAWGSNPAGVPSVANTELTVEAWVKSRVDNLTGAILGRMDSHGIVLFVKNNEPKFGIRRFPIAGQEMRCNQLSPTSTECIVESGSALAKDVWTHIAGVLVNEDHTGIHPPCSSGDGSEGETPHIDIYVNGNFMDCATTESKFATDPTTPKNILFSIGTMGDGQQLLLDGEIQTNTRFNGVIDEVRLWTVARAQEQIQACMNQELSISIPGDCYIDPHILKGYWRLNEGRGHQIFDASGAGLSGIIESPPGTNWTTGWVEGVPITRDPGY